MKKEQIINSARELFTKYGFKKVSMNEIATHAGVTKKTIYSYFKDKEDLLKYFLEEQMEILRNIKDEIQAKDLDFFETVHQTIYEFIKFKKQDRFLVEISKEVKSTQSESVANYLKKIDNSIEQYIKGRLDFAVEKGYVNIYDTEIMAFLIYKMYISLIFEWDNTKHPLNEREISDNLMQILSKGIFNDKGRL